MPAEQTNVKVAVRVRPYNRQELEQNQRCIIKVIDKTTLLFDPDDEDDEFFFQGTKQNYRDISKRVNKKLSMEFDRVFDTDCKNIEIFQECTAPLVDAVLNGYNCSVFVYGATGAGKTFTMLGNESCKGLTFLTMRDLFDKMEAQSDLQKYDVGVSYLEVYNEHVMNLFTKAGPLKLLEDCNGVVVSGLLLKPIYSAEQLLELLKLGNSNRTQHPTDANAESSRSHAIFQVHIRITDRKTGTKRTVKLSMIDLAGSERAASTKGIGLRFKEGASINKSLLALGNCINKLADGLKHIPYRDSNLTRILKDSLGGNCQTLMVANVSMSSLTYEDTYNTLKYASRAKKIRSTVQQNVVKSNMPKTFYIKKVTDLMVENERLKENNKALEVKLAPLQKISESTTSHGYDESRLKQWYSKIDAVYSSVIKTQEYVVGMQSKIKNLNFRRKLKEDAEGYKKILILNQSEVKDLDRFAVSSASKIEKEELPRWRRKLQDEYRDLEKLNKEIKESKCCDILQIYIKSKELEIQNSKKNIDINHITSINSELVTNSHKLGQAFSKACEILQKCYDNLLADQNLGPDTQKSFDDLQRLVWSNCLTIKDEYKTNINEDLQLAEVALYSNKKRMHFNSDDDAYTSNGAAKRPCNKQLRYDNDLVLASSGMEDTDSDSCGQSGDIVFKMPPSHNLNETHVLSSIDDDSHTKFNLKSTFNRRIVPRENIHRELTKNVLVSNILSEQIAKTSSNKDQLKQVLLKSKNFNHQGLMRTVAVGVQKENEKYSSQRVHKNPRNVGTKTTMPLPNFGKKPAIRITNNSSEPMVRTNRAAAFRTKK